MKTFLFWISLVSIFCASMGCNDQEETATPTIFIVKSGTSFGECWGYCLSEMTINTQTVDYYRVGWGGADDPEFPRVDCQESISETQQQALQNSFDATAFQALAAIIGCPDCADGGAEWIEVTTDDFTKRVTFDYLSEVESIATFQAEVRTISALFENCE